TVAPTSSREEVIELALIAGGCAPPPRREKRNINPQSELARSSRTIDGQWTARIRRQQRGAPRAWRCAVCYGSPRSRLPSVRRYLRLPGASTTGRPGCTCSCSSARQEQSRCICGAVTHHCSNVGSAEDH